MAELRRILIDPKRINSINDSERLLRLDIDESHYLRRVLRLRKDDNIAIIDGIGSLWEASIYNDEFLKFKFSLDKPIKKKSRNFPLLCLAVVLPRRGFDEMLRMICEIGIDTIQPLTSTRKNPRIKETYSRWNQIIKESVELSERLWTPNLLQSIHVDDWLENKPLDSKIAIAHTRDNNLPKIHNWLEGLDINLKQVWVLIGPEGGWTREELNKASDEYSQLINLGKSILRTSTASVYSTVSMVSWREIKKNLN
tara:strand:+ start:3963 stop:4724 length:762 start_codon:yes stop_codon:yes gene_type:complete